MHDDLDNPHYYINREFSALTFNERVLALAKNTQIPLLERMRFLCIASVNMDEFFEIRIAGLKEQLLIEAKQPQIDGCYPAEILKHLGPKMHAFYENLFQIFNTLLLPSMRKEGIYFLNTEEWSENMQLWATYYFKHEILPILSPIALDLAHPFPRLFNKGLNFIITLEGKDAFDRQINYALLHAPRALLRLIPLPSELVPEGGHYFVYLTSIIKTHAHRLFPGMTINGCYAFRLTRNSELFLEEEEIEDLAEAVKNELFSRHYGHVVRLEIEKNCPEPIVDFLLQKHHLRAEDAYYCDGPVNISRFLDSINQIDLPHLKYPAFTPAYPLAVKDRSHLFDQLDECDILVHHPYETYNVVIDFVRQAAIDPDVLSIKQTLYRTRISSDMVQALIEAARSGKEVAAVIELRARFDEASNLELANHLIKAGVLVLYGVLGYKTHAKMTLVVRKKGGLIKRYAHLGTGNYHDNTAKQYTDLGLLTANPLITGDTQFIFQQLTGLGKAIKLKALYHAPFTLHHQLLHCIEDCIRAATAGEKAEIFIKVNGITDKMIIKSLYRASQAGVKIRLICRSLCCLRPGIPGISDNIRVVSIVGEFLEHHRVFYFAAGETKRYYCSSADLMERNLYNRIEILFPILDVQLQKRIRHEILKNYLKDNRDAWIMQPDGSYKPPRQGQYAAQQYLLKVLAHLRSLDN